MGRAEKAERIVQMLEDLYPEVPIPLDHTDAYTLLVAVALSAQTTDKKVNEVTPALFAKANTPAKMAALEVDTIRGVDSGDWSCTDQGKEFEENGRAACQSSPRRCSPDV